MSEPPLTTHPSCLLDLLQPYLSTHSPRGDKGITIPETRCNSPNSPRLPAALGTPIWDHHKLLEENAPIQLRSLVWVGSGGVGREVGG